MELSDFKIIKNVFTVKKNNAYRKYFIAECKCGKHMTLRLDGIKNKKHKFCQSCINSASGTTHTESSSRTRLYTIWAGIKNRVKSDNIILKRSYKDKKITVCSKWKNYLSFKKWATKNGYTNELSIDRIDNNGNYEPSNCRWTTKSVQARNTRKIRSNNTSGYRGVSWVSEKGKFKAVVTINSKSKHIGYFNNAEDAATERDNYIKENNLEHTLNF